MKRLPVHFFAIAALLLLAVEGRAQFLTPEFHLDLRFTDTLVEQRITPRDTVIHQTGGDTTVVLHDTTYNRDTVMIYGRRFGYDPAASDAYDSAYGEDSFYPTGQFGSDVYFDLPIGGQQSRCDIRQKPAGTSFRLIYTMHAQFINYPKLLLGSILWDPSQIPSSIKAITISLEEDTTKVLADMKKQGIFTIPIATQASTSGAYQVILYYGSAPSSVGDQQHSESLISLLQGVPNPYVSSGRLSLTLAEPTHLTIVGYDVAGRMCLKATREAQAGGNEIDLGTLTPMHGAIMIRIDAISGSRHETRNVMVVKD